MKKITILLLLSFLINTDKLTNKVQSKFLKKVLWSQEDVSHNNYRIPSLIVSEKNTLLAFIEGREGGDTGNIDILLRRSEDNGETWDEQIVVWDDGDNTCGNPTPVIDQRTGRIILFMTWNLGSDHESDIITKKSESTRIPYMCYSDDDGLTWSKPKNLLTQCKKESWGWYATGPGVGIQLKSEKYKNRLVIPCNNSYDNPEVEKRGGFGYGALVLLSDDGGENWKMSEMITPEVNESQIIELSDGHLMMNMRSYNGKNSRAVAYSYDGGETWSEVTHDMALTESVCQGSIIQYSRIDETPMTLFSNPAVAHGRTQMTIKASFDDGKTWPNSKLVFAGPSAYSCLSTLPNGNIGLFFEGGEKGAYEKMIFVSFEPKELFSAGALLNSNMNINKPKTMEKKDILGLRTTIYKVGNIEKAKKWYADAFQIEPYFDEPFYVGFNIGGYELGLQPEEKPTTKKVDSVVSYWGVVDIQKVYDHFISVGATAHEKPYNVGGEMMTATVIDPFGNYIGLIYNPYFELKSE